MPSQEALPPPNTLKHDLSVVLNSNEWRTRYPGEAEYLTPDSVTQIIDHIKGDQVDQYAPGCSKKIDGLGDMSYLGEGESKTAILLQTESDKKLVVKATMPGAGAHDQLAYSPADPKMLKIKSGLGKDLYEYSDLATVLVVSTGGQDFYFQEYGEPLQERRGFGIIGAFKKAEAMHRLIRHAEGYPVSAGWFDAAKLEAEKGRHQLQGENGRIALIDVPIEVDKVT